MPTPTLTTLISFNSADGAAPEGSLILDSAGDLFGTTYQSASGYGTVFEVVDGAGGYASAPNTFFTFNGVDGADPKGSLITDGAGDLFGTSSAGGLDYGTVFEVTDTAGSYATAPTTLVQFNLADGASPQGDLVADGAGDLFGTAAGGGGHSDGVIFEVIHTANGFTGTPTILASFDHMDGALPNGGLIADAAGDLFGTASAVTGGDGAVFELANSANGYSSTPTVLVAFNGTDGEAPQGSLIADAAGDLFGTTQQGGTSGDGTVFEIVKSAGAYMSTPTVLVSFNDADGANPAGSLIMDAAGNLFGTTSDDIAGGDGTVFEIANGANGYASTPTTLVSFAGTNGDDPLGSLVADANGDLFGTTYQGTGSSGTVFEITNSGYQTVPCYLRGTRVETDHGPVAVEDLAIGDRLITRSGAARPIRWIGRRAYAGRFIAGNRDVLPIRIAAGALGDGIPRRDLHVSPSHAMYLDGMLVPAASLLNGRTITQSAWAHSVEYFHLELDAHDVIFAEGAASETFVDDGGRAIFHNAAEFARRYPDAPRGPGIYCAPRVTEGAALEAVRARLAA